VRKLIRRRVPVEDGLVFDYEVSPHRAFLTKAAEQTEGPTEQVTPAETSSPADTASDQLPPEQSARTNSVSGGDRIGIFVPFKQSRLRGQTNPLRPPLHVETVLIGRALGQHTGYLSGVGFRVRDDGYVEAEFADGVRKFDTYEKFEIEIASPKRNESG
jgi:hypothetical protein